MFQALLLFMLAELIDTEYKRAIINVIYNTYVKVK